MGQQVVEKVLDEHGDGFVHVHCEVCSAVRAVADGVDAVAGVVAIDAQRLVIRNDVPGFIDHVARQKVGVWIDARCLDQDVGCDRWTVVEHATECPICICHASDLTAIVNDVDTEFLQLLFCLATEFWIQVFQKPGTAGNQCD